MSMKKFNVGIDIGGTFTDLILMPEGGEEFFVGKILTTPHDPSIGAIDGLVSLLKEQKTEAGKLKTVIHGTTLVANAIIERRGAKTGMVTTQGFRDVLEIGRERRYDVFDIFLEMPEPLVPRYLRKEVWERVRPDGSVAVKLGQEEAARVAKELIEEGVESIAVCFLHSFRNPQHEIEMRRMIKAQAPGTFVSLSHEVIPEIREYERFSTTVANAYTQPLLQSYISQFDSKLCHLGFNGNFFIMLSSGGIATKEIAERFPVRIVESGPAAGAEAASFFGTLLGYNKILSFDMGGTTAKVCLIEEGVPRATTDFEVAKIYRFKKGSGLPIKLPVIELVESGAGGGSIAHIDKMGLLKVGPQSAGADPGPCCYGRGGEQPTVTDADLVLGYLDPRFFLGGRMALDEEKAKKALTDKICRPLGIDLVKAAWGIHQVVNENMANAARIHAVEKGEDPKGYAMVAFGGAGPVHAYGVCQRLRIRELVCPLGAGVISALGFLIAPISFDLVRSHLCLLEELDVSDINRLFSEMEEEGYKLLTAAGLKKSEITMVRSADMRYQGQGHEIVVPIPRRSLTEKEVPLIQQAFDEQYKRLYHRTIPGARVEGLNWRVIATGPKPVINLRKAPGKGNLNAQSAIKGTRPVYFPEAGGFVQTKVFDRYRLAPGLSFPGPAVVEERESTTIVGPRAQARTDEYLNLIITLER